MVWEFRASPAEKTLFSLRFNGDLMFPEAMLASEAPNAGSFCKSESGTYYFLFRNNNPEQRSTNNSNKNKVDIWCSIRSPGEHDMIERREYVFCFLFFLLFFIVFYYFSPSHYKVFLFSSSF